jgi:hypothetical protein
VRIIPREIAGLAPQQFAWGLSGLTVTTNDGGRNGYFGFRRKSHVSFANLSSALTINGASYTLEGVIKSLASAISANPSGDFALASNYDASVDGTYTTSPIQTDLTGVFEVWETRFLTFPWIDPALWAYFLT